MRLPEQFPVLRDGPADDATATGQWRTEISAIWKPGGIPLAGDAPL